jgi:hypothetical protein
MRVLTAPTLGEGAKGRFKSYRRFHDDIANATTNTANNAVTIGGSEFVATHLSYRAVADGEWLHHWVLQNNGFDYAVTTQTNIVGPPIRYIARNAPWRLPHPIVLPPGAVLRSEARNISGSTADLSAELIGYERQPTGQDDTKRPGRRFRVYVFLHDDIADTISDIQGSAFQIGSARFSVTHIHLVSVTDGAWEWQLTPLGSGAQLYFTDRLAIQGKSTNEPWQLPTPIVLEPWSMCQSDARNVSGGTRDLYVALLGYEEDV